MVAVYTHLSFEQFEAILRAYDIGQLRSFDGIADGVSNTNYLIQTSQDKYIATIYEKREDVSNLNFYWGLMEHLASDGVPCPVPIRDLSGGILQLIDDCPFAIVSFLEGKWPKIIHNQHCHEVGRIMAKMHNSAQSFDAELDNSLSVSQWQGSFNGVKDKIDEAFGEGYAREIQCALDEIIAKWPSCNDLPYGVIHGDLFPDNVFFVKKQLSGLLDFYLSCNDFFVYDVAIAINAWVFEHGTEFNITKAKNLLKGYNSQKELTKQELEILPIFCAGAAMRFLISRLYDYFNQVDGAVVNVKDPMEYLKKLRFHLQVKTHREYGL